MITVVNVKNPGVLEYAYIGRKNVHYGLPQSALHNPHRIGKMTREEAIEAYRRDFWKKLFNDEEFKAEFVMLVELALQGDLALGCWCAPQACHGDVLKMYIERFVDMVRRKQNGEHP